MDPNSTPFPGKSRPLKPKINRKPAETPKTVTREPPISRQKRVFGTVRSTNIPIKPVTEKPILKPSIVFSPKHPKSTQITQPPTEAAEKKSPENPKPKSKKKSVSFPEKIEENPEKNFLPRTPVPSPSLTRPKILGTPYYTAENCSKSRFDRLETSPYWIGQIKLAESVAKHFVSAAFFRLAFESNAEPIRSLRVELKRYLARHEYLSEQKEWREVSVTYGLLKDGSNKGGGVDSGTGSDLDQEQNKEHPVKEPKTKTN